MRKWSWILGFHAQKWVFQKIQTAQTRIPFILGAYLGAKYGNWRKHDDGATIWQLPSLDFHADRTLKLKQIFDVIISVIHF